MRKLLFLFVILSFDLFGQNVDWSPLQFNDQGIVEMCEVVSAEGKSKDEIYLNLKSWFVEYYKNSKQVIQFDDKDSGVIMGKAITSIPFRVLGKTSYQDLSYTIKVEIKDGRYRVCTTDYIQISDLGRFPVEFHLTNNAVKKNGEIRDFPLALKQGIPDQFNSILMGIQEKFINKKTSDW